MSIETIETCVEKKIYWWYASLVEFHNYDSFQISEFSKMYNINPCHVPSYQEFHKLIQQERNKEIEKINSLKEINNTECKYPIWIQILLNENEFLFNKTQENLKKYGLSPFEFNSYYDFCIKIMRHTWDYENSLPF